jgi:hypothetical protein
MVCEFVSRFDMDEKKNSLSFPFFFIFMLMARWNYKATTARYIDPKVMR